MIKVYLGYSCGYSMNEFLNEEEYQLVQKVFDSEEKAKAWVDEILETNEEWRDYYEWLVE